MNKRIRLISLSCTIFLIAGIFSGCKGSSDKTNSAANPTADAKKNVTMRMGWWGSDARHKATLDALKMYTDKNPNIKIEGEYAAFDAYYQKLMTQFAGGTAPDIMQVSSTWLPDLSNFAGKQILVDYKTDKDVQSIKTNIFDPKILSDVCTINGKLLGLPTAINVDPALLINSDFFAKFNIPTNTVWDWDNLLSIGKEVHQKDSKVYLVHSEISIIRELFTTYVSQKTGKQFITSDYSLGFGKDDIVDAYKYIQKLYADGVLQPYSDALAFDNKPAESPKWINGETGMVLTPVGTYSAFNKGSAKYVGSKAPVAKGAKDSFLGLTSTMLLATNNSSANKKEAADFINWFFTDKDAVMTLGEVRGPQPTETGRKVLLDANKTDKNVNESIDLVSKQSGTAQNLLYAVATFQKVIDDSMQKVLFNKSTPDAAADELIKLLQQKCNESKKAK